jgi:hypothetical protein
MQQSATKKEKTVHWRDEEANNNELQQKNPFSSATIAVNPQQLNPTLLQNSFHGGPPIFPPAPSPFNLQPNNHYQTSNGSGNLFTANHTFPQA